MRRYGSVPHAGFGVGPDLSYARRSYMVYTHLAAAVKVMITISDDNDGDDDGDYGGFGSRRR